MAPNITPPGNFSRCRMSELTTEQAIRIAYSTGLAWSCAGAVSSAGDELTAPISVNVSGTPIERIEERTVWTIAIPRISAFSSVAWTSAWVSDPGVDASSGRDRIPAMHAHQIGIARKGRADGRQSQRRDADGPGRHAPQRLRGDDAAKRDPHRDEDHLRRGRRDDDRPARKRRDRGEEHRARQPAGRQARDVENRPADERQDAGLDQIQRQLTGGRERRMH